MSTAASLQYTAADSPTTTDSCHLAEEEPAFMTASGGMVEAFWMNSTTAFQASPISFNRYLSSLRHYPAVGASTARVVGPQADGDNDDPRYQEDAVDALRRAILFQINHGGDNSRDEDRFVCAGYESETDHDEAVREAAALALVSKMSNDLIADVISATASALSSSSSFVSVATASSTAPLGVVAPELGIKRPRAEEKEEAHQIS